MGSLCYDPIKKTKSCPHCDGAERAAFLFFIYVSAVGRSAGQKASEGMFSLAQTLFSILPRLRFGKRSPKAAARRGETLSVTASPATSPERERLWQGRKVYRLSADFFLPLTNEDETHPLCQGLHLRGRWHFAKRNDGRGSSRKHPSPARLCRATSPERERLWQGCKVYGLTSSLLLEVDL